MYVYVQYVTTTREKELLQTRECTTKAVVVVVVVSTIKRGVEE